MQRRLTKPYALMRSQWVKTEEMLLSSTPGVFTDLIPIQGGWSMDLNIKMKQQPNLIVKQLFRSALYVMTHSPHLWNIQSILTLT